MIAFVQLSCRQNEMNGYEKRITTINYIGPNADTSIQIIQYDINGNQIERISKYITSPIAADTIYVSDNEIIIEHSWDDNSKTTTREINLLTELTRIGIGRNGTDTIYYANYELGENRMPIKGIVINQGDTIKYEANENFTYDEINKIQSNIIRDSEFINLDGRIEFQSRKQIVVTHIKDTRNTTQIQLDNNLNPTTAIKKEWHEYHKIVFENEYSYHYEEDKLVRIENRDEEGDLEMLRTIEYIPK